MVYLPQRLMYRVQLYGKVKKTTQDPTTSELEAIQKTQDKVLRFIMVCQWQTK